MKHGNTDVIKLLRSERTSKGPRLSYISKITLEEGLRFVVIDCDSGGGETKAEGFISAEECRRAKADGYNRFRLGHPSYSRLKGRWDWKPDIKAVK